MRDAPISTLNKSSSLKYRREEPSEYAARSKCGEIRASQRKCSMTTTSQSTTRTKHVDLVVPVDLLAHKCEHVDVNGKPKQCPSAYAADRTAAKVLQWDPASESAVLCNGVRVDRDNVAWIPQADGSFKFHVPPVGTEPPKPEGYRKLHNEELRDVLAPVKALEWAGRFDKANETLDEAAAKVKLRICPETTAVRHAPVSIGVLRKGKVADNRNSPDAALAAKARAVLDKTRWVTLPDVAGAA